LEKRTLIALVLIFAIFWLSNELIWKRKAPVEAETTVSETVERDDAYEELRRDVIDRDTPHTDIVDLTSPGQELFESDDIPVVDNLRLENELMTLVFSNRGGVLKSVLLHNFYHYDKVNPVNLIPAGESLAGLEIETSETFVSLDGIVFNWERSDHYDGQALTFYLENENQRLIEKRFRINDDYSLHQDILISGIGEIRSYQLSFGSGISDTEETIRQKDTDYRFIGQIQNTRTNIQLRKLKEAEIIRGNADWAAIRSKYFIMAVLPEQRLLTDNVKVFENNESPAFELTVVPSRVAGELLDSYELYLGPLDYVHLQRYGVGLEETIEMGWKFIRPLGRFFLWLLTNLNKVFGNYGITIIFFALILKIVLYPLTHKSFSSTHKMQKVQPYMQEIQRKYKSDPKQMQTELQKLYKEHGVNPLGGCFPLLLQMPIFFALYPVLRYSVELRQASFMLWLTDLLEPDPYLILPILMGIFMFVQQKMMAPKQPADKEKMDEKQLAQMQSQKMMMYIMPVFMVFIFRTLPSGLVLYWTVFNVFSIIQQYYIVKKFNR